jgi:hypothetical protein
LLKTKCLFLFMQPSGIILGSRKSVNINALNVVARDPSIELLLSGLVTKHQGKLKVYNGIYQTVFDRHWIENNYL